MFILCLNKHQQSFLIIIGFCKCFLKKLKHLSIPYKLRDYLTSMKITFAKRQVRPIILRRIVSLMENF